MESSYQIYKITNSVNGKSYIGQTIQVLNRRWCHHKSLAQKSRKKVIKEENGIVTYRLID